MEPMACEMTTSGVSQPKAGHRPTMKSKKAATPAPPTQSSTSPTHSHDMPGRGGVTPGAAVSCLLSRGGDALPLGRLRPGTHRRGVTVGDGA